MKISICINLASAAFAVIAAVLWLISARVKVWADGQTAPLGDRMIIFKDGRPYNVTASVESQSRWSAYAAVAAAAAAGLQALATMIAWLWE